MSEVRSKKEIEKTLKNRIKSARRWRFNNVLKGRKKREIKKVIVGFLLVCLTPLICTYPVQAATPAEIDAAITNGMVWLATQQNPDGSWGTSYKVGKTGFAVLKFETHAIQNCTDPLNSSYQYYAQIRDGLDYIFANAHTIAISTQPAGDPDTDGDGIGVYFLSGGGMMRTYETGIAMMAIAASTHPEMAVNVTASAVNGWNYSDVLQDAVDYLAFGQNDAGWQRGGWGYSENDGFSTNSNTGYAVRGLAYAEAPTIDGKTGFACTIPAFVRSELNIWIDYIQNDVNGDANDGGSGYTDPNTWVNILKTGNLLFEMAFYGDTAATQRVQDAIDYLVRHWNDANNDPGWKGQLDPLTPPFSPPASYQAMYTTMKGLEILGIYPIDGIDWYADFADVLLAQQLPDGSWPQCIWDDGERILATEWALLTLQSAIPPPRIESCDSTGVNKDLFNLSETVYVNGSGYSPSTTYDIYIVNDVTSWSDGVTIPTRVSGTITTVSSNSTGDIPPTAVWSPDLTLGKYDIVVDVNNNSKYDVGIDALDDMDIEGTAGFHVIPEFPSFLILPLFVITTLLAVIVYRKKHHM